MRRCWRGRKRSESLGCSVHLRHTSSISCFRSSCGSLGVSGSVAQEWIKGSDYARKAHEHCPSVSLAVCPCRFASVEHEKWHGRGRRFDPDQVHQVSTVESRLSFSPESLVHLASFAATVLGFRQHFTRAFVS